MRGSKLRSERSSTRPGRAAAGGVEKVRIGAYIILFLSAIRDRRSKRDAGAQRAGSDQLELFITDSLKQLVPDEHVLARVDRVFDLSWLSEEVTDCYCANDGWPGIDPEAAVRLMLADLLSVTVHDRKLMREAQVNIAIRWFAGYCLHQQLPHP